MGRRDARATASWVAATEGLGRRDGEGGVVTVAVVLGQIQDWAPLRGRELEAGEGVVGSADWHGGGGCRGKASRDGRRRHR